jgi:hypothetical protein
MYLSVVSPRRELRGGVHLATRMAMQASCFRRPEDLCPDDEGCAILGSFSRWPTLFTGVVMVVLHLYSRRVYWRCVYEL